MHLNEAISYRLKLGLRHPGYYWEIVFPYQKVFDTKPNEGIDRGVTVTVEGFHESKLFKIYKSPRTFFICVGSPALEIECNGFEDNLRLYTPTKYPSCIKLV